jgi:hypothetical protein
MNIKPYPLLAIAFLALAACRPAATEWTESEASKRIRLDNASVPVNVRFAPGSAHLLPADAARSRWEEARRLRRRAAMRSPPRCCLTASS